MGHEVRAQIKRNFLGGDLLELSLLPGAHHALVGALGDLVESLHEGFPAGHACKARYTPERVRGECFCPVRSVGNTPKRTHKLENEFAKIE